MSLIISGKGDFDLLSKFKENDFPAYELYLDSFNGNLITEKIASLPSYIKINSIHNPTKIVVDGNETPFNLTGSGKIGEESLEVLKKTINLGKELGSKVIVVHGATYNPNNYTKDEALKLLAEKVKPLLDENINLCFETDALWYNQYYDKMAILSGKDDFIRLNELLDNNLKITVDVEHLHLTFYFLEFIRSLGGERFFLEKNYQNDCNAFQLDLISFINTNQEILKSEFYNYLKDFFESMRNEVFHIHLNGSDCFNFIFNPHAGLPLIGEHLPLGFKGNNCEDRLDYQLIAKLFRSLPEEKEINVVLEIWTKEREDFVDQSKRSKDFFIKYLNNLVDNNLVDTSVR